ncbi:MAG TPA: DUF6352 family protein [Casimicrobiaceae bacterium]
MPQHDYWSSSGYRHLTVGTDGRLTVTDAYLRAQLLRPELAPIVQSCDAELALHDALVQSPRRAVTPGELDAIRDDDARENYRVWLRFRDRLVAAPSLEAAYVRLFQGDGIDVPPLFVHETTRVLLRHVLGDEPDALQARAAEMLFRPQTIAVLEDGAVMAADESAVELYATTGGFGNLGELLASNKTPMRTVDMDVLSRENADEYWQRDERHDMSVSLNRGQPALDALARVLERWIRHFLDVEVAIVPERRIDDDRWVWHVGLDAEASGILNDLYNRVDVDDARMGRLVALFRLTFAHPTDMRPAIAGRPVYLAMAIDEHRRLRLKPQNLLLNLPLARTQ